MRNYLTADQLERDENLTGLSDFVTFLYKGF